MHFLSSLIKLTTVLALFLNSIIVYAIRPQLWPDSVFETIAH